MKRLKRFDRLIAFGLVGLALLLIPNVSPAYAQPVAPGAIDIEPGFDLFETDPFDTFQDFSTTPIPAGFFGSGCEPFDGVVDYQGVPLDTSTHGTTDTIVERLGEASLPEIGSEATVEIQLVELHLQSVEPFQVNCNGEDQLWMVDVSLSDTPTPPGQMTITRTHENGGVFDASLQVRPFFTFISVDDPTQVVALDTGFDFVGIPAFQLFVEVAPWVSEIVCPFGLVNQGFCPGIDPNPPGQKESFEVKTPIEDIIHDVWPAGFADFGDAIDPTYPTLLISDGARHTIEPGFFLGAIADPEPDGQPTGLADGDDINLFFPGVPFPTGDEDGVAFTTPIAPGGTPTVEVTASSGGLLDAWVDFNSDGDWADDGEQIFASEPLSAGVNVLSFPVPPSAALGETVSRFRLSRVGGLRFHGPAPHGEVEDYLLTIAGEHQLIDNDLALVGLQTPAPGTTPPGGIFTIVATFEYTGTAPIDDLRLVVTSAGYIDGGAPGPELANRDSGTPSGVGAELTVALPGGVLGPGGRVDVTFDILIPRTDPFGASVSAFTTP